MCVQYWSVKRRSSGEIFRITPPYLNRAESLVVVLQQNHSPALNTLGVRLSVEAPREAGGGRRKGFWDLRGGARHYTCTYLYF